MEEQIMTAAVCPTCGAPLEIVEDSDKMQCKYCGVVALDSRHTFSHVARDFETELEHHLVNAQSLLDSGYFGDARVAYSKLITDFGADYRVWWGLAMANSANFADMGATVDSVRTVTNFYDNAMKRAPESEKTKFEATYKKWIDMLSERDRKIAADRARRKLLHNIKNLTLFAVFAIFLFCFWLQCNYFNKGGEFPELTGVGNEFDGVLWLGIIAGVFSILFGIAEIITRFSHAKTYINLTVVGCTAVIMLSMKCADENFFDSVGDYAVGAVVFLIFFTLATMIGRIPAKIADGNT